MGRDLSGIVPASPIGSAQLTAYVLALEVAAQTGQIRSAAFHLHTKCAGSGVGGRSGGKLRRAAEEVLQNGLRAPGVVQGAIPLVGCL